MQDGLPAGGLSHDAIRTVVSAWAATEPLVRRIYLFGSRARGDNRPDSDIDLAILNNIDPAELATCIRSALPRDRQHVEQLAASARTLTFRKNCERWQALLATRFGVPVQVERSRRTDQVVRPSLKRCRVLLYRNATSYLK
jgi:small ligand-binding sensory domain FIST